MVLSDIIDFILTIGVLGVACVSLLYEKKAGISPAPVLPWVRRQALILLMKHSVSADIRYVADLGCGWGGMVGQLRRAYPSANITGYEISPCPYAFSWLRFLFSRKNVTISHHDFFTEDISGYDAVFCYLSPQHMEKLKPQLERLKKGSLVVTCSFPIQGWTPLATVDVWSIVNIPISLYRI